MSSFTVFYDGQKKNVKLASPNVLLQQVVVDSAEHFRLAAADCSLRHKNKTVDISVPLRFCSFPNNATFDLVVNKKGGTAVAGGGPACKVALSVTAHNQSLSLSAVLPSSSSLGDMLSHFVDNGHLSSDALMGRFELIYMRSSFNSQEALDGNTLASLGLAGQAARFQLRILDTVTDISQGSSSSASPNAGAVVDVDPATNQPAFVTEAPVPVPVPVPPPVPTTAPATVPPPVVVPRETITATLTAAARPTMPPSDHQPLVHQIPSEPMEMEVVEEAVEAVVVMSPSEAIDLLLTSNFDATSKPAVATLYKYIANIAYYPHEDKFQTVNASNKVFVEKVLPAKNIDTVFLAFGFAKEHSGSWKLKQGSQSVINEALAAINRAFDELQIPDEDRPKVNKPVLNVPTFEFDPFKYTVVRNAIQPIRELSATDVKLEQLQKRRVELEGLPSQVERETEAVFPTTEPSTSTLNAAIHLESADTGNAVSRSIMQKILKGDEDTPLTTKALKDLHKAQTERVYNKTLIRIRFPDKTQLMGYFHPKHTVADLYAWVASSLRMFVGRNISDVSSVAVEAFEHFELYTTPPRTVMAPFPSSSKKASKRPFSLEDSSLLNDLNLVPAAVISCSWKNATLQSSAATNGVGSYLLDELIATALSNGTQAGAGKAIPQGLPLIEKAAEKPSAEDNFLRSTEGKAESKAESKDNGKASKPKWFKL